MAKPSEWAHAVRVELETKLGFLEHTVDALNEVVLSQERTLDRLGERLAHLEQLLGGTGTEEGGRDLSSERPPHY